VSFFVLSPEIEDRGEVEVNNWMKHKKTFYFDLLLTPVDISTPRIWSVKTRFSTA
jgi:hypothetical protein